jgi:putative transposase
MCRSLNVARSGFFAWLHGKPVGPRKADDAKLLVAIKAAHERGRGSYGPSKIQEELAEQDLRAGINCIKRLCKQAGIRCKQKRKFKATTDSRHALPITPNRLERRFNDTTAPNQVWVADMSVPQQAA